MKKEEAEKLRKNLIEQIESQVKRLSPDKAKQVSILKEQIKKASPDELEAFVKQLQARTRAVGAPTQSGSKTPEQECLFCRIIEGKIKTFKVYEDQDILAILDIYPANPGHLIVMPKKHFQFINEIPDPLIKKLFIFVKTIEPIILEVTKAKGMSIYIAQGPAAGQIVGHFSINIIPRFENDDINFTWQKKKISEKEIEKLANEIRKKGEKVVSQKFELEQKKRIEEKKTKERTEAEKLIEHVKRRIP